MSIARRPRRFGASILTLALVAGLLSFGAPAANAGGVTFGDPIKLAGARHGEPGIRVQRNDLAGGNASSDRVWVHAFESAWRSDNGGANWTGEIGPTAVVSGDSDMAWGYPGGPNPDRIYKTELNIACEHFLWDDDGNGGGNLDSWSRNDANCGLPSHDRQWLQTGPAVLPDGSLLEGAEDLYFIANQLPTGGFLAKSTSVLPGQPAQFSVVSHFQLMNNQSRFGTCSRGFFDVDQEDGSIHVVDCLELGTLRVYTSEDGGITWSKESVTNHTADTNLFPVISVDDDGGLHVTSSNAAGDLRYSYRAEGGAWGDPVTVVAGEGVTANQAVKTVALPWVDAGEGGKANIAYLATTAGPDPDNVKAPSQWHLWMSQTQDGGQTWTSAQADPHAVQTGCISTAGLPLVGAPTCPNRNLVDFLGIDHLSDGNAAISYTYGCARPTGCDGVTGQSTGAETRVVIQNTGSTVRGEFSQPAVTITSPENGATVPSGVVDVSGIASRDGNASTSSFSAKGWSQGRLGLNAAAPPSEAPEDPEIVDATGDIGKVTTPGAGVPADHLDVEAAWFENDDDFLYVGLKLLDIPADPNSTAFSAYHVNFKPDWVTDPKAAFNVPAANTYTGLRVQGLLSPVGFNGLTPGTETAHRAELQVLSTNAAGSTNFAKVADLELLSVAPDSDIVWWSVARPALKDPEGGDALENLSADSALAMRGRFTLGVDSAAAEAGRTFRFSGGETPLVASAGGPYSGAIETPISISGSATGGTPPYACAWSGPSGASFATASACDTTVSFTGPGSFTIGLTVTDGAGNQASASAAVSVDSAPAGERVDIYVDGTTLAGTTAVNTDAGTPTANWTVPADLSGLSGQHQITARWFDANDALLSESSISVTVDGSATDTDGDGFTDDVDNCPNAANPLQEDSDGDGTGDACETGPTDSDGDGVVDGDDNCPDVANAGQQDADEDGIGDACDSAPTDSDEDGVADEADNCPEVWNPGQEDADGNDIGNACEDTVLHEDHGTIALPNIFGASTTEAEWLTTCPDLPSTQGDDAHVFILPDGLDVSGTATIASGPGEDVEYDLDMSFYGSDCVPSSIVATPAKDEVAATPAGTRYVVVTLFSGENIDVTLSIVKGPVAPQRPPRSLPDGPARGTYPATPNDQYFPTVDPLSPIDYLLEPGQWGPQKVRAPQAWSRTAGPTATGAGVRVAVIDTGIDVDHPDLSCPGKLGIAPEFDAVRDGDGPQDIDGHGTHVAGIIGACTNNTTGIAGVAPDVQILPIQAFSSEAGYDGDGDANGKDDLADAIRLAADYGAHVINMSLSFGLSLNTPVGGVGVPGGGLVAALEYHGVQVPIFQPIPPEIRESIEYAQSRGVVIVASAGNDTSLQLCDYPAIAKDVICVGATDSRDARAWYSNGPHKPDFSGHLGPAVVAPGGSGELFCDVAPTDAIFSLWDVQLDDCPEGAPEGYQAIDGTSMASPHVAAIAALAYDRIGAGRSAENAQSVIQAIIDGAVDLGTPGYDPVFAYGRVDAVGTLDALPVSEPVAVDTTLAFTDGSADGGQYSDDATIAAQLTDEDGAPIEGSELTFELTGTDSPESWTATTDADGVASVTRTLSGAPGSYNLTVNYAGETDVYNASANQQAFEILKEETVTDLVVAGTGSARTLTATATHDDPTALDNAEIVFSADGAEIGRVTTDANGVATLSPAAPYNKGAHDFSASFAGNVNFGGSSDVAATGEDATTLVFTGATDARGPYSDDVRVQVSLIDEAGDAVVGEPVTFELTGPGGSRSWTDTTDDDGIGGRTITLSLLAGEYTLVARYDGRVRDFAGSTADTTLVIEKETTATDLSVTGKGKSRTLTATLTEDDGPALGDQVVVFFADGTEIGRATTNAKGVATLGAPLGYRGDHFNFEARFAGTDNYRASSGSDQT